MGGSAFSSLPSPPYTPRMPREVYQRVVSACGKRLRELFVCVATPIEGPGKKDHGDIDMLVALEKRVMFPVPHGEAERRNPHELMAAVRSILGADYAIVHPTGTSAHLAIPWPSDLDMALDGADETVINCQERQAKYIQVDVRICSDVDQLCWLLFKHAHGDIWNILGSIIRPYGLTVDEEALWLRIPEIEKFDRKKARVYLSRNPVEILHFLGMRVEDFWVEPFESVNALYEYAASCRLFQVRVSPGGDAAADADEVGAVGGEEGRKKMKSNDRRRMKYRPVYRCWIDDFIPRLRAEGRFVGKAPGASIEEARAAVRDEAFARFFVEAAYKTRLREWKLKRDDEKMKSLIKELVPSSMDPQRRACLVSALRKILMEDDQSFGFTPLGLRDPEGFYNTDVTREFIRDNMGEIGDVAWIKQQQRAREAMQHKVTTAVVKGELPRQVRQ